MTSANTSEDLHQGRGWLNRAAEMLDSCEDHVSDAEFAHAAAIIGNGFIALAHAERAAVSMAEVSQVRQAILSLSDEPEPHADDCAGCEGPGQVPCAADRVVGDVAYREGEPIKDLARPHDDEPPTIVHVVAEDDGCVLHVASTAGKAEQWLMSTAGNREARDALSITELAVDRG